MFLDTLVSEEEESRTTKDILALTTVTSDQFCRVPIAEAEADSEASEDSNDDDNNDDDEDKHSQVNMLCCYCL